LIFPAVLDGASVRKGSYAGVGATPSIVVCLHLVFQAGKTRSPTMRWITREHVKVDRVGCPWLIKRFVDPDAEFYFVPPENVLSDALSLEAIPFDVSGVELGHHRKECSFEAILKKYNLTSDPALEFLGRIVNGADTDDTLWRQPEAAGLKAVAEGFRNMVFQNDHELIAAEWIVYDASYAQCRTIMERDKANGASGDTA
jgi:hypothetical protein